MSNDREYFEADNQTIGYRYEGYRDFGTNLTISDLIINEFPSCIAFADVGGARGYLAKHINKKKNSDCTTVIDSSLHCYHTRAIKSFVLSNIIDDTIELSSPTDVIISNNFLEHIPEDKIYDVISKLNKMSSVGMFHIITTSDYTTNLTFYEDSTHKTYKPLAWWLDTIQSICPHKKIVVLDSSKIQPTYPLNYNSKRNKINFGSYINMFYYGWENVDILDLSNFATLNNYFFNTQDITKPLFYPDEYADMIFTSHMIEYISYEDAYKFLKECHRILKPGGNIRIATPDTRLLTSEYLNYNIEKYKEINKSADLKDTSLDKLVSILLSNHKYLYDHENLTLLLHKAGFELTMIQSPFDSVSSVMKYETTVSHPTISLVVEAMK